MLLCLDVGNSHVYGGVFLGQSLLLQFRYPSGGACTSDQLGVFFRSVLRENNFAYQEITQVAICSVVPSLDYSLRASSIKYFNIEPEFLHHSNCQDLTIDCNYANELGADRLANIIAAINLFPRQNLIVVDLGTATTFEIISKTAQYEGGVIMAGLNLQMKTLHQNTAKLPPVNIIKPHTIIGQNTISHIQAGLYYGHLGAIRAIIDAIAEQNFSQKPAIVIGTGGFASLFEQEKIFQVVIPELVLQGLRFFIHGQQDKQI
jgi:type III pantothenate kinase